VTSEARLLLVTIDGENLGKKSGQRKPYSYSFSAALLLPPTLERYTEPPQFLVTTSARHDTSAAAAQKNRIINQKFLSQYNTKLHPNHSIGDTAPLDSCSVVRKQAPIIAFSSSSEVPSPITRAPLHLSCAPAVRAVPDFDHTARPGLCLFD